MRKDLGSKTYLYPMPVLIIGTYDEKGEPDAMNAAWGGICDDDRIAICLSAEHKTTKNIIARKAFTVSPADAEHVTACDYVGITSGNDVPDKFARAGFHALKSAHVDAPLIEELPLALECELVEITPAGLVIGRIVNVSADERILGAKGKVEREKLDPIAVDSVSWEYTRLGEVVGKAFSDGKKIR